MSTDQSTFPPRAHAAPQHASATHGIGLRRALRIIFMALTLGGLAATTLPAQSAPTQVTITPNAEIHRPVAGTFFELTASADGTPPLTYQWYEHGNLEPIATGATLSFDPTYYGDLGSYRVQVSNASGSITSEYVKLIPWARMRPRILESTPDQSLTIGGPLHLKVVWQGSLPITIEWSKDGEVIQSGPKASYHVPSATAEDGGIYTVKVSNALGYSGQSMLVTPLPESSLLPPIFTHYRTEYEQEVDNQVTLYANLTGHSPITFELLRDGEVLSSTENSIPNKINHDISMGLHLNDLSKFGDYRIRARNQSGTATTDPIKITRTQGSIPILNSYASRPSDTSVVVGETLRWTATIHGTPPFTFQWFKNGAPLPFENKYELYIQRASLADAGVYYCEVRNPRGLVRAAPAVLTVLTEAPSSSPEGDSTIIRPFEQYAGDELWLSSGFPTQETDTIQWEKDGTILPGETGGYLVMDPITTDHTGIYYAIGTNSQGTQRKFVSWLVVRPEQPAVVTYQSATRHPLVTGQRLYLDAYDHNNQQRASYQWFKDGEPLAGQTSSILAKNDIQPGDAGTYHATVTTSVNATRSHDMVVTVAPPDAPRITRQPATWNVDGAKVYGMEVRLENGIGATYQWSKNGEPIPGATNYYLPNASDSGPGNYTVEVVQNGETLTSQTATIASAETGAASPLLYVEGGRALSFDGGIDYSNPAVLTARTRDVPDAVQWKRNGEALPGQNDLTLWMDIGDVLTGEYTVEITTPDGTFASPPVRVDFKHDENPPAFISHPPSQSKLRYPTGGSSTSYPFKIISPAPTTFQWYRDGQPISDHDNPDGSSFTPSDYTTKTEFFIRATNRYGHTDSATFFLYPIPATATVSPTILAQPRGFTTTNPPRKNHASLSVVSHSALPQTYQWFLNSTPIPGATHSSIHLGNDLSGKFGQYHVEITNPAGITRSEAAEVVYDPTPVGPETHSDPASVSAALGSAFSLNILSSISPGPLTYQWYRNGEPIPGATSYELVFDSLKPSDEGSYTVTVTSGTYTYTSPPATVEVSNAYSPLQGRHRIVGNGVFAGQPVQLQARLVHSGDLTQAGYSLLLPTGWSLAEQNATGTSAAPTAGTTDLLEWAWTEVPASPITFNYTLTPPSSTTGTEELAALLESTHELLDHQALARPDPLVLAPVPTRHHADTDQDGRLSLGELLRVIELYNTRHGTARTGRYRAQASTADGFEPDADHAADAESLLRAFHHADSNWDGHLSLGELLRVIELYNQRTGTTRTGAYHRAADTVDGFAPGTGD